jgi:hypothetical protein
MSKTRGVVWRVLPLFAAVAGCSSPAPPQPASQAGAGEKATPTVASSVKTASPSLGIASNEPADFVLRVEPWNFGNTQGRVFVTPSYRVFTTSKDTMVVDRAPAFVERALEHYRTALAPLPAPKVALDTYLMATRVQWQRLSAQLLGDDAGAYNMIQRGGFTVEGRAILYDIGTRDTLSLIAHEGWHQFTQRTFAEPLPMWLEEGIASYMEGYRWDPEAPKVPHFYGWANVERFDQLRKAATENDLIPLDKLLVSSPQELIGYGSDAALNYYAQAWAMVHFLMEGEAGKYQAGLRALLTDAAGGRLVARVGAEMGGRAATSYSLRRKGPEPLLIYFNRDLGQLEAEYLRFIQKATQTGAKERIVAGRSPIS